MCILTSPAPSSQHHSDFVESPAERVLRLVNRIASADSHDPPRQPPRYDTLFPVRTSQQSDRPLAKCPRRGFSLTKSLSEPDLSQRRQRTESSSSPWKMIANLGRKKSTGPDQAASPPVQRSLNTDLERSAEPNASADGVGCPYHEVKMKWRRQQILYKQKLEASSNSWFVRLTMRCRSGLIPFFSSSMRRPLLSSGSGAWRTSGIGHGMR